jgi:hypothetical protein
MGIQHSDKSDSALTETCKEAFEILSQQIAALATNGQLSIEESADVFMYASETNFPSGNPEAANMWRVALLSIHAYMNDQEHTTDENSRSYKHLEIALSNLKNLWESESASMSKLQAHLLLTHLHDNVTSQLINDRNASDGDAYLSTAAGYAEALVISPYCAAMPDCFKRASSDAETYYRLADHTEDAERVAERAKQHSAHSEL